MMQSTLGLAQAHDDVRAVADLFREYVFVLDRAHGINIAYQDFEGEMATFPDRFEALWLARVHGAPAGAVALKRLSQTDCEMKRLYVRDAFRGLGLARRLCLHLLEDAKARGYGVMRLDTHASFTPAITLYTALGFAESEPHNEPGVADTLYFARSL